MDQRDYMEKACCFDSSAYTKAPDSAPTEKKLNVPEIIAGLDALYESGQEAQAQHYLEGRLQEARSCGDWRAELSIISELLGQYRRSAAEEKGLSAVSEALELINAHAMAETVSGATVMLNAATTLNCFSRAAESVPLFQQVSRVYSSKLDPMDYRFAGLYNNMALSYTELGEAEQAELYFKRAMRIMESCPKGENELAVTLCNMAQMYGKIDSEDERIEPCLERAWQLLNSESLPHDGYHAFTVSKCEPCFAYFGYFLYAKELRRRAREIYERA